MAKYNYDPITAKALELVNKYGTDIYLLKDSSLLWKKKYDRVLLKEYWENTDTTEIVFVQPEMEEYLGDGVLTKFKQEEIDGKLIKKTDTLIIATKIPEPELGDKIRIGSTEYKYINHESVMPNNVVIIYKVQVRI